MVVGDYDVINVAVENSPRHHFSFPREQNRKENNYWACSMRMRPDFFNILCLRDDVIDTVCLCHQQGAPRARKFVSLDLRRTADQFRTAAENGRLSTVSSCSVIAIVLLETVNWQF